MVAINPLIYDKPSGPFRRIVSKDHLELQRNPSDGSSNKMIEDTNPAYK